MVSRLLKDCADQFCEVLGHIQSLCLEKVPTWWKTSCGAPVLREPNHLRPSLDHCPTSRPQYVKPQDSAGLWRINEVRLTVPSVSS